MGLSVTTILPPPVARNSALREEIERLVIPKLHTIGIATEHDARGLRIDLDDPEIEVSRLRSVLRSCAGKAGYSLKTKVISDDPDGNPVAMEIWVTDWKDPEATSVKVDEGVSR